MTGQSSTKEPFRSKLHQNEPKLTIIRLTKTDIKVILKNTENGKETIIRMTPKYNYLMTLRREKK